MQNWNLFRVSLLWGAFLTLSFFIPFFIIHQFKKNTFSSKILYRKHLKKDLKIVPQYKETKKLLLKEGAHAGVSKIKDMLKKYPNSEHTTRFIALLPVEEDLASMEAKTPEDLLIRGSIRFKSAKTKKEAYQAIKDCEDILRRFPQSPLADNAQLCIAKDYLNLRQHDRAMQEFQKVIQHYSTSDAALVSENFIGMCYWGMRDYEKAIETMRNVARKHPNTYTGSLAQRDVSGYLMGIGRFEEAVKEEELWLKEYAVEEEVPSVLVALAQNYVLAGNAVKAEQILKDVVENYSNRQEDEIKKDVSNAKFLLERIKMKDWEYFESYRRTANLVLKEMQEGLRK